MKLDSHWVPSEGGNIACREGTYNGLVSCRKGIKRDRWVKKEGSIRRRTSLNAAGSYRGLDVLESWVNES